MKKELVSNNKDEFSIPQDFLKYKYLVFIAKTTSQKYDFILYTMRNQPNFDLVVRNKLWHICAFNDSIDDFMNLGNLINFTEGLKNIHIYQDNVLLTNFNTYRLSNIVECVKNASRLQETCLYCQKIETRLKEDFYNPLRERNLGISISFDLQVKKNSTKIKETLAAKQFFPCHQINNNFNPYDEVNNDLNEVYLANSLKQNPTVVNLCPIFNYRKYKCEFIDKISIE